jgi:very-short-patch-repair endonuclease
MAAVLACRGGKRVAVLSHRSAAVLWRLLRRDGESIDVSVAGNAGRKQREGLRVHRPRVHRPRVLLAGETTRLRGIPVTTPAVGSDLAGDRTRSELEQRFLRLCRRHGLQAPEVNVRIDSFLVDFLWRDRRVVVETDGYRYHRGRAAFEDDRVRDLRLRELGYDVIRLSYRQVAGDPSGVAAVLKRLT